jgi:GntR family transcriptional repressor for pyruvate dehydrogenase complex
MQPYSISTSSFRHLLSKMDKTVFKKIPRARLYEIVAEEIEKAILEGQYEVGARLPSEQSLADQFEVSRNVVREALKVLQERNLVEVLDGSGAYVARPNPAATRNALGRYIRQIGANSAIDALYETRIALEGLNARLAAQRATPDQIDEMATTLERMQNNMDSSVRWTEADLDFHLTVAKATNNPFQLLLLDPLIGQMREVIADGFDQPGATQKGLAAHIRLLEYIRSHDPEGAYKTMVDHLLFSQATIKRMLSLSDKSSNGKNT